MSVHGNPAICLTRIRHRNISSFQVTGFFASQYTLRLRQLLNNFAMSQHSESGSLLADIELSRLGNGSRESCAQTIRRKLPGTASTVEIHPISSTEALSQPKYQPELGWSRNPLQKEEGDEWSPGVWKQFPCQGVLALFGCVACIAASIAVLVVSDGQPTSSWTLSPTVYLAFLMAGTNMLARLAFNKGVTIAWWYKALRGSTVKDLHDNWAYADSLWPALFSGRQFSLVALGSIAVTVIAIDQPLIQRASNVITAQRTLPVNVTARIAPEIPWGFTGYQAGRSSDEQVMMAPMISAFDSYNSQTPINTTGYFSGCKDTCVGYVEAGGLSAKCNATSGPIKYSIYQSVGEAASPFGVNFSINPFTLLNPSNTSTSSYITMDVAYTNNSSNPADCSGVRTERTCYLYPATLRYPVNITGNILTIGDMLSDGTTQSFQPAPAPLVWISDVDSGAAHVEWTIGGLYLAANNLFSSKATYTYAGAVGNVISLPDTLSNQFLDFSSTNISGVQNSTSLRSPLACSSNWTDPTSHILSALNAMAFRLSMAAADFPFRNTGTPPAPQLVAMQQTMNVNVFHSEYRFLIASTLLTMLFIMLIVPTFIGWWELGRRMSLNPIETAKAFDAPLLQGPGSNAPLPQLVRSMGGRALKLGEVENFTAGSEVKRQLKLADPVEVLTARAGTVYV
ncbi:hypothetical protein F5884DRAFT_769927 [Xylogone sp. PMI_703]|nr:hypothetical protein F5884DRAFT_769927 [Xylogone sp. PMI_703]